MCGKPESVPLNRWFLKCLSNDQTAFSGFTSLVDLVEDRTIGYNGSIRLSPKATFVEPFILRGLGKEDQNRIYSLQDQLQQLDSTQPEGINKILREADKIAPVTQKRIKGKSPIFFYAVSDRPFLLPSLLYDRMAKAAALACEGLSEVAERFRQKGSLEDAIFSNAPIEGKRQFYTGSVDFMIYGNDIYLIDIGFPAVGYIADILFTSEKLGRKPEMGLDILPEHAGEKASVYPRKPNDLGLFT